MLSFYPLWLHSLLDTNNKVLHLFYYMSLKGIFLSKAPTCMKYFLYKKKMFFYQGNGYLWPHCCMNILYISHRSLYAPTYSIGAISSMLISLFRVTSLFDTVCRIVTRWVNFRKKTVAWKWTTIIRLQYLEVFSPKCTKFLVQKYIYNFCLWTFQFDHELFKVKLKIIPEIHNIWVKILLNIAVR